jgi:hypothetical protein
MSTSYFLLLPGELRNHIYSFCTEPKPPRLRRFPKCLRDKSAIKHTFGLYGSLQYVCQQVRGEFTPIYMWTTMMTLHLPTAYRFLKTFYPQLGGSITERSETTNEATISTRSALMDIGSVQGNIRIQMYFGQTLRVTDFVRLCQNHHNVKVTFSDATASLRLRPEMNELFADISSKKFCPDLNHTFDNIFLHCRHDSWVTFVVRAGSTFNDAFAGKTATPDPRALLISMGAPALESFHVKIRTMFGEFVSAPL